MKSTNVPVMKNVIRPRSPRYPKRISTYVVAFAVQEGCDDPQKLDQIPNMQSAANSTPSFKSISPTGSINSTKTFTVNPTEQLSGVIDVASLNEVKIDMIDENQCGDVEKKIPRTSSYPDNRTTDKQPEIIFNAPKHIQKCKENNRFARKKPKKYKRVMKFKNPHFKYKKPKYSIIKRLEHYENTKLKLSNTEKILDQIYFNILSKVVSRSRVLKKAGAKVNLLDDSEQISSKDGVGNLEHDNTTLLTTKESHISYTNQNTVGRKSSSSLKNEFFNTVEATQSVNQMTSETRNLLRSQVIHLAWSPAQGTALSEPKLIADLITDPIANDEQNVNVINDNTVPNNITPKPSYKEDIKTFYVDNDELSHTKKEKENVLSHDDHPDLKKKSIACGKDDAFNVVQTNSLFDKSTTCSDCTITIISDSTILPENEESRLSTTDEYTNNIDETALVDKVKILGFYPMKSLSFESSANFDNELNDVLVTKNVSLQLNSINKSDESEYKNEIVSSEFNKMKSMISILNDSGISAKITEIKRRTCADDNFRNNFLTDEMSERLINMLDSAFKTLEKSLGDRIENNIKAALDVVKKHEYQILPVVTQRVETTLRQRPIPTMLNKEVFVLEEHLKQNLNIYVQCDLVKSQVIDDLMLKLSRELPRPIPVTVDPKELKPPDAPEIVKDRLEILKSPVALANDSAIVEVGKGDIMTDSTMTAVTVMSNESRINHLKVLYACSLAFLRENMIVITSVPTFFIVLFCLYGVIVIVMKTL